MPQYENQIDSANRICPYCGQSWRVEAEDFVEDREEEECENCGMWYYIKDHIDITHLASPDCELNGKQHRWENKNKNDMVKECKICGKLAFKEDNRRKL